MNKPYWEDYYINVNINDYQNTNIGKYAIAMEKYCDELEKRLSETFNHHLEELLEIKDKRIEELEKALDKACEVLEEGYGQEEARYSYITCDDKLFEISTNMTAKQWKEWCLER